MQTKSTINSKKSTIYSESNTRWHNIYRKMTYSFAFRILDKYFKKMQLLKILEIGSGAGFFLKFARDHYIKSRLFAIEYDTQLIDEAKHKTPFVNFIRCDAQEFDLATKNFDIIVSFQVIEHLSNPELMLQCVKNHLNPKHGLFLFTTPNLSGLGVRIMKERGVDTVMVIHL